MSLWVALALVFFSGSVVATETWREYDSWEDRPLGVLDMLFGVAHQGLPQMPDWSCDKANPPRLVDGVLTVRLSTVGSAVNPYTETGWEELLSARLGVPVDVVPAGLHLTIEDARADALKERETVHVALRDGYFRGEALNEKIEGYACTNLAIVNAGSECQEGVAAHELGHVLGVRHSPDGLMRARAAACPATLNAVQTAFLLANSKVTAALDIEERASGRSDGPKQEETDSCVLSAC